MFIGKQVLGIGIHKEQFCFDSTFDDGVLKLVMDADAKDLLTNRHWPVSKMPIARDLHHV